MMPKVAAGDRPPANCVVLAIATLSVFCGFI
jgi:hypothetical protein